MHKTGFALFVLAAAALGGCSGNQEPSEAINTTLPPASPPAPTPVAPTPQTLAPIPAAPVPIYVAHLPPLPAPPLVPIACSPCEKVAFQSWVDSDIYSVNANGTELTRLASIASFDAYPAWSRDGNRVAFTTRRDNGSYGIYVMNADGSNLVHAFSTDTQWMGDPAWSPDGTQIAYATFNSFTRTGSIMLVSANGGTPMPLYSTAGSLRSPTWSPDGTRLAFERDWDRQGDSDIFLIRSDGSDVTPLTDTNSSDGIGYQSPSWSPDGTTIALNIYYRVDFYTRQIVVGTIKVDGSGLSPIVRGVGDWNRNGRPTWSPDGTMIAFESGSYEGRVDISWVRADGSAQGTIVTNGHFPDWQR